MAYLAATGLPLLLSSQRTVVVLGAIVLAGLVIAYAFYWEAFVSVWCFFAAAASVVILCHLEWSRRQRAADRQRLNRPQHRQDRAAMLSATWNCLSRLAAMFSCPRRSCSTGALAALQPLAAQNAPGPVEAGRRLASQWCSGCHSVEPNTVGIFAAGFAEIAKVPSTTALSLKVFLQTSHRNMPNFILQPDEADDIVAYIMSLKRK